jgi:methionyl-tRNA formyltransferase
MDVTILCSSKEHPVYSYLEKWVDKYSNRYKISLQTHSSQVTKGNFLFLISCTEIIKKNIRNKFDHTLVVHASDLPEGKGWSPHIWQILEGKNKITISLLEAVDKFDEGDIWKKEIISLEGHELFDEINEILFNVITNLMNFAIENPTLSPIPQTIQNSTYYPKRQPSDSELDPEKTISEQFNLLRVADENRFPCYFYFKGQKFKIILKKFT